MKSHFLKTAVLILLFLTSCKKEHSQSDLNKISDELAQYKSQIHTKKINNENDILNKELVQIVKKKGVFMLSCSKDFSKVFLSKDYLHIEISEPIDYKIDKIVNKSSGFQIYLKGEEFYYDISIENKLLGIVYWKSRNIIDNKLYDEYSLYTIQKSNLSKANLQKENCNEGEPITNWLGKYYLEISSTHGDGKEVMDKYNIEIKDLKNIEFTSENYKIIITGEFLNENTIEGEIEKVIKNKQNATTTFSPFLTISKQGDSYFVKCPLINQGAGFSSTPFEIEKL